MLTGQPQAKPRLSPRVLFSALTLTSIAMSECVARRSHPQPPPSGGSRDNHGLMTNLIPFKTINLGVLVYYILLSSQAFLTYLFINWLDILEVLDFSSIWKGSSKVAASTANLSPTLLLMCLLGTMGKAKAHTRRKMQEWWQERQLSEKYQQMRRFLVFHSWRQDAYRVEPQTEGETKMGGREQWRGIRGRQKQAGTYELEVKQGGSSYNQEVRQASSHGLEVRQAASYELEVGYGQSESYKLEEQNPGENQTRFLGAHNLFGSQSTGQPSKLLIKTASNREEKLGEDQERKQSMCGVKPIHKVILVKQVDDVVM